MDRKYKGIFIIVAIASLLGKAWACYQPPVAVIGGDDPKHVRVGETVQFDGSNSYDPGGGDIEEYVWSFSEGATDISGEFTANASCWFRYSGVYIVKLKVQNEDEEWSSEVSCTVMVGNIWYVNNAVSGGNDEGTSWADAFDDLQEALDIADPCDEIWVAYGNGPYYPTKLTDPGDPCSASFELCEGVAVYGNFYGGEQHFGQRLMEEVFTTVLSGSIGVADDANDDCYHVIRCVDVNDVILDRLTIKYGYARGTEDKGGGIYCKNSRLTVRQCVLMEHIAENQGGGIYCENSELTVINCVLAWNEVGHYGGGIYCADSNDAVVSNCTFTGNWGDYGKAIYNNNSDIKIINSILWDNGSLNAGGEVYNNNSAPIISYSDIYGSGGSGLNWDIDLGEDGGGNIDIDPNLIDPNNDDYHLDPNSPGIDGGDPCFAWGEEPAPNGSRINMGAYGNTPQATKTWDSDNDGLSNPEETRQGTDPLDPDSDDDTMLDGWEYNQGLDPLVNDASEDADDDGLTNLEEYQLGTKPLDNDSDDDAMPDGWEYNQGLNPLLDDAGGDADTDDLSNLGEYQAGTDPQDSDSDDDTMLDGWEYLYSLDPLANDAEQDKDGDGYTNIIEYRRESNPNDDSSVPANLIMTVPEDKSTIQAAIDWSINGDVIILKAGKYYESINLAGKAIKLQSEDPNDWQVIGATIIDGGQSGSVVNFSGAEEPNCLITGVSITGGYAEGSGGQGGGIKGNGTGATIYRCIIYENYCAHGGGGIYDFDGNISDCIIYQNSAAEVGGGLAGCNGNIVNCVITQNSAADGGGIYNVGSGDPNICNCTISGNTASDDGGGIYNYSCDPEVTNCIVWGNTAEDEGDEVFNESAEPIFSYCDIAGCGGSRSEYWNSSIGSDGGHNLDKDPRFINANDPAGIDDIWCTLDDGLRVRTYLVREEGFSLEQGRDCLDCGDSEKAPAFDLGGKERVDIPYFPNLGNGEVKYTDIGAYEAAVVWYVRAAAPTSGNGSSWEYAFKDLQTALEAARDPCDTYRNYDPCEFDPKRHYSQEIWVAAGTYQPCRFVNGLSRYISFEMVEGVDMYGGFLGKEAGREERNWSINKTVLNGLLDPNIYYHPKSYHVVKGADNAVLDGFSIIQGRAGGNGQDQYGGGMLNKGCAPTVRNCTFQNNYGSYGGGMGNINGANPEVVNCVFLDNNSYYGGSGICNYDYSSCHISGCQFLYNENVCVDNYQYCSVVIEKSLFEGNINGGSIANYYNCDLTVSNCTFRNNKSTDGGGIYSGDNDNNYLGISDCVFINNTASGAGKGGGVCAKSQYGDILVNNCLFKDNVGGYGGGIYINSGGTAKISNCVFCDNTATLLGGGLYISNSTEAEFLNCTIANNTLHRPYNYSGRTTEVYSGGIHVYSSGINLTNCILWNNVDMIIDPCCVVDSNCDCGYGGEGSVQDPNIIVERPSEIYLQYNSTVTLQNCDVKGGWEGAGVILKPGNEIEAVACIDDDPCFLDPCNPAGLDGILATYDDGLRLRYNSPGIDVGYNKVWPEPNEANGYYVATDILNVPRVQDADGVGPTRVDLGAYEFGGVIAYGQDVEVNEDEWVAITLEAEDIAEEPFTFTIAAVPEQGELSGTGNNLTYTPDPNYNGWDSFVFKATDESGNAEAALVSITIIPQNDPPEARGDAALMSTEDANVVIPVLANDTHPDGDSLSIIYVSDPDPNGSAVNNGDGTISYTPEEGYYGPVYFAYTIADEDSTAQTDTAVVTVEVHCPPIAVDDSYNTLKNVMLRATGVLDNDVDYDGDELSISEWDFTSAENGMVRYVGEGTFLYMPNRDYTGSDAFTYTITDPVGNEDTASVTISVQVGADNPSDPNFFDSDGDGIYDIEETDIYQTDPYAADTDEDGLSDGWELFWGLDPLTADDPEADPDNDGLSNLSENQYKTNPNNCDTDGDGISDGDEVKQGSDPTDPQDGQAKYYPHPLPYHTAFVEFQYIHWDNWEQGWRWGCDLNYQNGWQVSKGSANIRGNGYKNYVMLDPCSVVRKELTDEGADHEYIRLNLEATYDAQIKILGHSGESEMVIAGVKFGANKNVYVLDNGEYVNTQTNWFSNISYSGGSNFGYDLRNLRLEMDYETNTYKLLWQTESGLDLEPCQIYEGAEFGFECEAISTVVFQSGQGQPAFVQKLSINDRSDTSLAFTIDSPCHCEDAISQARTPVIGSIAWDKLGSYTLGYCPGDKNPEELYNWFGFDGGTEFVENGVLGYWDTGMIPNGYYYLGILIVDDWGIGQLYIQEDGEGNWAPVIVTGEQKCNTLHHEDEPDISVNWPGQFPFELKRIYNNNRRFDYRPFPWGWKHNYHIRLTENTNYYYDFYESFWGGAYGDHSFLGYGDVWITYPDGSVRMFRHDSNTDGYGKDDDGTLSYPSIYRPYPDDNTGERLERVTSSYDDTGYIQLTDVEYKLIERDGTTLSFTAENILDVGDNGEYQYYSYTDAEVGWELKAGVKEIADRFGNKLKIQWDLGTENPTVTKISYDKNNTPSDSTDDTIIQMYFSHDTGYTREVYVGAELWVDTELQRKVVYYWGDMYPDNYDIYWIYNFRIERSGALALGDNPYNPEDIDQAYNKNYIYNLWYDPSWNWMVNNSEDITRHRGYCDMQVRYDAWGRVYQQLDPLIENEKGRYLTTQFGYLLYHPDPCSVWEVGWKDRDPNVDSESKSYLRSYALTQYGVNYTWQDDKGAVLRQQAIPWDLSATPIVVSQYENTDYPLKPTYVEEQFDGFIRKTYNSYNYNGDLTEQIVKNTSGDAILSTTRDYHPVYPFVTRQTSRPGTGQLGHKVETRYVYGKNDGTIDQSEDENNKYLIEEKTLLRVVQDSGEDPCFVWADTKYTYENNGQIKTKLDPCGISTVYEYDDNGFVQWVKVGSDGAEQAVERYYHDVLGQMRLKVNRLGGVTCNDYDDFGHLYQVRTYCDPCGLNPEINFEPGRYSSWEVLSSTVYGYDKMGNRAYEQRPSGGVVKTEYTRNGLPKLIEYDTGGGSYIANGYDNRGKKVLEYHHCDPNTASQDWYVAHAYDNLGRATGTLWYDYDDETIIKGRLRRFMASGKKSVEKLIGPDLEGELCLQRQTNYEYNILGQMTKQTVAPDTGYEVITNYSYDVYGNRVKITDPNGNLIYFDYDNANRKVAEYFAAEAGTAKENAVLKKRLTYYPNNEIASESSYDYDGETVLAHNEFGYDERGRLSRVEQFMEDPSVADPCRAVTIYEYSDSGFGPNNDYHLKITDAEGKETYRQLDEFERLTKILYPSGDYQEMGYNGDGTLKERTVFNTNGDPCVIGYDYDPYGRLKKITYPDEGYIEYTRNGFGRKIAVNDNRNALDNIGGSGEISFEYDPMGREIARVDQDGYEVSYTYWADGQKGSVSVSDPCANKIYEVAYYLWPNGRLRGVFEPELEPETGDKFVAQFEYDANGNRNFLEYYLEGEYSGNYLNINYTYNRDNLLTGYETEAYGGGVVDLEYRLFNVEVDGLGRLADACEVVTLADGSYSYHYHNHSYDMLSQLTGAKISNIESSDWNGSYIYNKDGNIRERIINSDPCAYEYDGDLMVKAEGQELDWDLNGNLTGGLAVSMEYNWDNKLRYAQAGDNSIALKYDPEGNRIWKRTCNSTNVRYRKYIIAEIDNLANILLEIDPCEGTIKKAYVYAGDQLIMQHDGDMSANRYFYLHDRLGSVRQVIDVNASVKHLYTYGPFGKKLESDSDPDNLENSFQFTGLFYDEEIEQSYARARQYKPQIYRFTSYDPVIGDFTNPATLHPYLYCLNDPINNTDPTGETTKEEVTVTTTVGSGMAAAGSPQALSILNRVKDFANTMSQRNWIYGETITKAGDRINLWARQMNRLGMEIHHIVGRGWGNLSRFGSETINSAKNLIALDPASHGQITAFFNSGYRVHNFMLQNPDKFEKFRTLQQYVSSLSFNEQFIWGQTVAVHLATYGTLSNFAPVLYGLIPK